MSVVAWTLFVALPTAVTVPAAPEDASATEESLAQSPDVEAPPSDGPAEEDPAEPGEPGLDDALRLEAIDRFVDGRELFDQGRYLEAGAAYRRSYAAAAAAKTLYNIGLSYEKGGEVVQALEAYRRYLSLPDCSVPPTDHCAALRSEVEGDVVRLRAKVGELSIQVDDGVELLGIEIRDRIVPPEDFPLILAPGHYEIRERGYGQGDVRIREIDILPGQVFSLLVVDFNASIQPIPETVTDPGPPSRPSNRLTEEERRRRLRIAFYSGVGITAAAGIATGVVGGLALSAYREQDARCRGVCPGTDYPFEERERVDQLRPVTNALIGVTAGLGITTVVVGLFAFSGKKGRGARASVTRVTPTPGGVRVRF